MNSMQARVGERGIDLADRLPRDIRSVVHEYGLSVVMALYNNGVRTPSAMREVLRCVFLGAREPGNKRPGSHVLPHLDTFLVSAGSHLTAGAILRAIRDGVHDRINRRLAWSQDGRKWAPIWQRDMARAASDLNHPRLRIHWLPVDLRERFGHRLATRED